MITRKIRLSMSMGLVGCKRTEVVELGFHEGATEEEIEDEIDEYALDWLHNQTEHGWEFVE